MERSTRRRKLFEKSHGICHWCGTMCEFHEMNGGGKPGLEEATIDHIYSDRDPRRKLYPGQWVLAHARCNYKRADIENQAAEKLWRALSPYIYEGGIVTHDPEPLERNIRNLETLIKKFGGF